MKIAIEYITKFIDELMRFVIAILGVTKKCIVGNSVMDWYKTRYITIYEIVEAKLAIYKELGFFTNTLTIKYKTIDKVTCVIKFISKLDF